MENKETTQANPIFVTQDDTGVRVYFDPETKVAYYCAKDIAKLLHYSDYQYMVRAYVPADHKHILDCESTSGVQKTIFVSKDAYRNLCQHAIKRGKIKSEQSAQRHVERTIEDSKTIRSVIINGVEWYSVLDICKSLKYANVTQLIQSHVNPADCIMTTFETEVAGLRRGLAVNERGRTALIEAAKAKIKRMYKQMDVKEEEDSMEFQSDEEIMAYVKTLTAPPAPVEQSVWKASPNKWMWFPKNAKNVTGTEKIMDGHVLLYQTQESNMLLTGGPNCKITADTIKQEQMLPTNSWNLFDVHGNVSSYQEALLHLHLQQHNQDYQDSSYPARVPAPHQFTLDLLLSDYIEELRRIQQITRANTATQDHTLSTSSIEPPAFIFRPMAWFAAFYYTPDDYDRPHSSARVIFKSWIKDVLASLDYLISHGIITICEESVISGTKNTELLRSCCSTDIPVLSKIEKPINLKEGEAGTYPYTYKLKLNPAWSRTIGSTSIGNPLRLPPIIGRKTARGAKDGFKYTANRILCVEAFKQQKADIQYAVDLKPQSFKIKLHKYCSMLGLPILDSNWIAYRKNQLKKRSMAAIKTDYTQRVITNVLECYNLFKLQRIVWDQESANKASSNLPMQDATLYILPLYTF